LSYEYGCYPYQECDPGVTYSGAPDDTRMTDKSGAVALITVWFTRYKT